MNSKSLIELEKELKLWKKSNNKHMVEQIELKIRKMKKGSEEISEDKEISEEEQKIWDMNYSEQFKLLKKMGVRYKDVPKAEGDRVVLILKKIKESLR